MKFKNVSKCINVVAFFLLVRRVCWTNPNSYYILMRYFHQIRGQTILLIWARSGEPETRDISHFVRSEYG